LIIRLGSGRKLEIPMAATATRLLIIITYYIVEWRFCHVD